MSKEYKLLKQAALAVLLPVFKHGPSYMAFEIGVSGATVEALERQSALLAEYRKRVAGMADPLTRRAYGEWLDFYQAQNDEAWEEYRTGTRRRAWLKRKAQQDQEFAAIGNATAQIERP